MRYKINKKIVESFVDGYWYVEPLDGWELSHVSESRFTALGSQTLFIAMDEKTWQKGTGNTGIYAGWTNTHELVHEYQHLYGGVIAQYPIKNIDPQIPQFITPDPFEFINQFSKYIRDKLESNIIAITGTVGKTTTKDYLSKILNGYGSVYATNKNHNSRTGVKLTLANAMHNPDYVVLETAMSALWMKSGGISRISRPHIALITEIGVGQKGFDEIATADMKSRIADGIEENGLIILNRDIQVFDSLQVYAQRFSTNILTYGVHEEADIKIVESEHDLVLSIMDEQYQFSIPQGLDYGTIHNLTAVISVIYALKLDLSCLGKVFSDIKFRSGVLEKIQVAKRNITLIDDTYNAEHLSMINAFKFCRNNFNERRKVLIVGDIVNLYDKSLAVHESLAEPILCNDFKLIATFGKDTQILHNRIPANHLIGHFTDVKTCVEAVSVQLRDDDVVLIKGSRRNSTIHHVPSELKNKLENPDDRIGRTLKNKDDLQDRFFFDVSEADLPQYTTGYGLGGLLLIYLALKKYALKKIKLDQLYCVTENVAREGASVHALGLAKGEVYTFLNLMQSVVLTHKADAMLALAECLCETTNKALVEIRSEAKILGIDETKILNVTGRNVRQQAQSKSLADLFKVIKAVSRMPKHSLGLLNVKHVSIKNKIYQPSTLYAKYDMNYYHLIVGDVARRIQICFDQEKVGFFQCSSGDEYAKEYLIPKIMANGNNILEPKKITLKTPYINLLGDTYLGEFYTRIRQRRGVQDALQRYGYNYSFEKLVNHFSKDDLNLVNLECSFTKKADTALGMIKPFVLDANAESTIAVLKASNFNVINLANNHSKDFGHEGLEYTLDEIEKAGFEYTGAGLNQIKAEQGLTLSYQNQHLAIFNGYWHRETAYLDYDFFALGEDSGVAGLSGLLQPVMQYRAQYPNHKVVVIAHWGVDFLPVQKFQTHIAEQLVAAGADLVIGHGPHTLQPIRQIAGKPVIFSVGNGVFNSNGEFDKYKALPYGMVSKIDLSNNTLKLYPFFASNLKTFWQPIPVDELQFKEVLDFFQSQEDAYPVKQGHDQFGYFIEMEIFQQ